MSAYMVMPCGRLQFGRIVNDAETKNTISSQPRLSRSVTSASSVGVLSGKLLLYG